MKIFHLLRTNLLVRYQLCPRFSYKSSVVIASNTLSKITLMLRKLSEQKQKVILTMADQVFLVVILASLHSVGLQLIWITQSILQLKSKSGVENYSFTINS